MRKRNTATLFEKDFLNSLVEDQSSCVVAQDQNYHLALHPFHLNNINESLKDILNQGIAKYDKKLDGILLGYQNIKLLSQSGAVTNDSFFIHIDIAASFFLFKPEVGKILTGIVNKKSKDHVACLVHKTFNVSLPKPEDVEDDDDDWMGTKVEIEQEILFRITFVNLEARLPYIRAEFVAILNEQDSGISTSEENVEKTSNKANRKPTKIVFESNSEDEESQSTKKKKKKKRKKQEELENEEQEEIERKKHKHKLHNVENLDLLDGNKKKKSKHKDLSGILELEVDEKYDHKKKKGKHKNRSHEAETDIGEFIEYVAHTKEKEKILIETKEDHTNTEKKEKHKDQLLQDEYVTSEKTGKKKKSKQKHDLAEVVDLDHKKKKGKHKNRSHEAETDTGESTEYDARTRKKEKILMKDEEGHTNTNKKEKHKDQLLPDEYVTSEKTGKKKKPKQKHDLAEVVDLHCMTKKKKKSKHKTSLEDLTNAVLQRTLLGFSENQSNEDQKSTHKKEHKNKNIKKTNVSDDLSSSLPELNLSNLFGEGVGNKATPTDNFQMADNEDKISKKRRSSISHANFWDSKTALLADSDLENIIQDVDKRSKHKHRKERSDESPTKLTKKRRRSSSGDDFVTPVPKKKHKKTL